jgi:hypothetical protein
MHSRQTDAQHEGIKTQFIAQQQPDWSNTWPTPVKTSSRQTDANHEERQTHFCAAAAARLEHYSAKNLWWCWEDAICHVD